MIGAEEDRVGGVEKLRVAQVVGHLESSLL